MKPSSMPTLSLLLLFAFLINLPLLAFSDKVLDTGGTAVNSAGQYYIVPAKGYSGGGFRLAQTGASRCAVTVLRDNDQQNLGRPAQFRPKENPQNHDIIDTGILLSIQFSDQVPPCASNSKWGMFTDRNLDDKTIFVGIGSADDNPDIEKAVHGYFQIDKSAKGYKLVFCQEREACKDLGLSHIDEHGKRLISPAKEAIEVIFVKANTVQDAEYIKLTSA